MPAKDREQNINAKLTLVVKSGKFKIGYRNTIRALRAGQAKLILISSNCPAIRRTELEYYAVLAKADVHHFDGNNVELGTALGKLFAVSALVISDPGDSDILESV
jgi:large subunit ribosomal protein L30e